MRSEVEDAREAERARIAREIHDGVAQDLLVLRMELLRLQQLQAGAIPATEQFLSTALVRLDATLHSVRQIINDLHPAVLDQGLVEACAWLAQQFQSRSGTSCKLLITGVIVECDIRCKNALFRILQEALNNVTRHAAAANVTVVLAQEDQRLALTVMDDGVGLGHCAGCAQLRHGIKGMRERALMLGGQFRIASLPTGGTVLHATVPLARERRERSADRRWRPVVAL